MTIPVPRSVFSRAEGVLEVEGLPGVLQNVADANGEPDVELVVVGGEPHGDGPGPEDDGDGSESEDDGDDEETEPCCGSQTLDCLYRILCCDLPTPSDRVMKYMSGAGTGLLAGFFSTLLSEAGGVVVIAGSGGGLAIGLGAIWLLERCVPCCSAEESRRFDAAIS